MKKVAMIGVGKLGQDCAEIMAEHYDVVGYDVAPRTPIFPMRNTVKSAVEDRDIIFIAAPTPHESIYGGETPTSYLPNRDFDYSIVGNILEEVNQYVNKNQLIVLISTVLPGTVRSQLQPKITNARFIYNPYLIAMGSVKWDMVNPEMVIIGTEDGSLTGDAKELIEFYRPMMQNNPRYEVGTWDEAEAIKIFYNTFISTKIALVNMIQDVAERNGNMNVEIVTKALANSTHRIMGPAYMTAGMGDGGACHPRDNIALRYMSEKLNLGYDIFDAIMLARERQAYLLAAKCLEFGRCITIIGKAYKPGVPYTNGSSSLLVGYFIQEISGEKVNYYDPHTGDLSIPNVPNPVFLIGYWEDWVEKFPFPHGSIVIDPWRKIKPDSNIVKIIHYGNTRKESLSTMPANFSNTVVPNYLKEFWPELNTKEDESFVLYMGRRSESSQYFSEEFLTEIINESIKEGKTKIIFDNAHETFIESEIRKIYNILPNLNIESSNVYYITSSLNADVIHEMLCEKNGWENKINIVILNLWGSIVKNSVRTTHGDDYNISIKNKKFLSFNRNPHWHRICLLGMLLEKDLVKDAYYSYYDNSYWRTKLTYDCIIQRVLEDLTIRIFTQIRQYDAQNKLPLTLTLDNNASNPNGLGDAEKKLYENTYFSLISETYFFHKTFLNEQDSIFLTEKTYNAILMKHPFILAAIPGSLQMLRDRGFKTFSPYIDESYDELKDDKDRLIAIVDEVERLCKFTDQEWLEWQNNIKEIVEHNYQVLISSKPQILNKNSLPKF